MAAVSPLTPPTSPTPSIITFTHKLLQNEKETNSELSHNFGISTIKVGTTSLLDNKYHFVITFDRSGSMSRVMGEVKHTIKNMLNYLCDIECDIFVTIMFFDHELIILKKNMQINEESKKDLIEQLETLDARGTTNFELPFQKITELYMEDIQNIHIFMTDGHPNVGETRTTQLFTLLDTRYEHNFMGFGVGHNENLLYTLTEKTNGNYYFIDSIENAGMIYGEVLNKILYRRFENITYSSLEENPSTKESPSTEESPIEFYNYKTNEWSNTYSVGSAGSEDTFTTHFRFPWDISYESLPLSFTITYNDLTSSTNTPIIHTSNITEQEYHPNVEIPADMRHVDVEKYYYRQLVLEKMFVVNKTNRQITQSSMSLLQPSNAVSTRVHSDEIETLFNKVKTFMEEKDLTEDLFMKQLLDDLSILFRSQRNPTMSAYGLARQISQGAQRAYNVVNMGPVPTYAPANMQVPVGGGGPTIYQGSYQSNVFPTTPPSLSRCWGGTGVGRSNRTRGLSRHNTGAGAGATSTLDPTSSECDPSTTPQPPILQHALSQVATSVYTSPHQTTIMRGVSGQ